MNMRDKILLGTSMVLCFAVAGVAQAAPPAGNVTTTGGTASAGTFTAGTSAPTSTVTGNPSTSPFTTVTTTTQLGTTNPTLTGAAISSTGTVNGQGYTLTGTAGAAQTANAQAVTTTTTVYTNPPQSPLQQVSSSVVGPVVSATSGVSTSAITVAANTTNTNSSGGLIYAANLNNTGNVNGNTIGVVENDIVATTSGLTFAQYTGTATYNSGTQTVSVAMNATPAASTSLTSSGLTTTGTVAATTVNATTVNANRIVVTSATPGTTNGLTVGTPVAGTDAANKDYVDGRFNTLNTSVTNLNTLVEANRKRSDAGIATAVALSGGTFLPDKKINLTANVGAFRDEVAVAAQLGVLVSENVALNAGVATSLHSYGGTAVRGGVTFGF